MTPRGSFRVRVHWEAGQITFTRFFESRTAAEAESLAQILSRAPKVRRAFVERYVALPANVEERA